MAKAPKQTASFEQNLTRIEALVAELERPNVPLDEAISYYEEGVRLIKTCNKMLMEAEQKVTIVNDERK